MQDLRITLVQVDQKWEDKTGNLENYAHLLQDVQTDLIILPEMFHTCFTMNASEQAEKMEKSMGIDWLKKQARANQAAIYTSLIIDENRQFYNRGIFVYPDGNINHYDKRKLFGIAGEDKFYTAGKTERIVEYKGWKINLQICYDLRFPENCRNQMTQEQAKYDLLLYVANWPSKRSVHWNTLLAARAIENQCYVVGVNRVGKDENDLEYSGDSKIINLLGEELSNLYNSESVYTQIIQFNELKETRKKLPFLKDIRF